MLENAKLSFKYIPSKNKASDVKGGWMITNLGECSQWKLLDRENPRYRTVWGVQELCNQWREKTQEMFPLKEGFLGCGNYALEAYEKASKLELEKGAVQYYDALKYVLVVTEIDLLHHLAVYTTRNIDANDGLLDDTRCYMDKFREGFGFS